MNSFDQFLKFGLCSRVKAVNEKKALKFRKRLRFVYRKTEFVASVFSVINRQQSSPYLFLVLVRTDHSQKRQCLVVLKDKTDEKMKDKLSTMCTVM